MVREKARAKEGWIQDPILSYDNFKEVLLMWL
jgi:hypothetical protein